MYNCINGTYDMVLPAYAGMILEEAIPACGPVRCSPRMRG